MWEIGRKIIICPMVYFKGDLSEPIWGGELRIFPSPRACMRGGGELKIFPSTRAYTGVPDPIYIDIFLHIPSYFRHISSYFAHFFIFSTYSSYYPHIPTYFPHIPSYFLFQGIPDVTSSGGRGEEYS